MGGGGGIKGDEGYREGHFYMVKYSMLPLLLYFGEKKSQILGKAVWRRFALYQCFCSCCRELTFYPIFSSMFKNLALTSVDFL